MAEASVSIVNQGSGLDFWQQIACFKFDIQTKEESSNPSKKTTDALPIDPTLAAQLRPFNGFYRLLLIGMSPGPQFPINPIPGPIMPGPFFYFDKGFLMIDQSVEYTNASGTPSAPSHKVSVMFKADYLTFVLDIDHLTFVQDITKQIISPGGFDPTTQTMKWSSHTDLGTYPGSAKLSDLALSASNPFVSTVQGMFNDATLLAGGNQLAPAGLDVFVGNYENVLGGAPPCIFYITKSDGGFKCTITQLDDDPVTATASSITYNEQMYLLSVPDQPPLRKFVAMLGTYSNVGLVAYVMGKHADKSPASGFIGINMKPQVDSATDKLHCSALWSRVEMHSAKKEGAKKKDKKAEAEKKTQSVAGHGVQVTAEIAKAMHPFNGFYALTGDDISSETTNWLCIDRRVTYNSLKSPQKGVPQYTVQVTYQINDSSIQDISQEATKGFDPSTNTMNLGEKGTLNFSTRPLSMDQTAASECEGQIAISEGKLVSVSGTNSLTAPDISMYAGNYEFPLKEPEKGPTIKLALNHNEGTFEIALTSVHKGKAGKSVVVPQFTYDPQMFTVNIPAYPKADMPPLMVMLGTVSLLGCVAYVIIKNVKKPHESQIEFLSTNLYIKL